MAKPILTVGIPSTHMPLLNKGINFKLKDHHVISYPTCQKDFVFQVFYDKDIKVPIRDNRGLV